MSNFIDTGNEYADYVFKLRLVNDPFFWALTDYLEHRGLLDREEFLTFINDRCKADVIAKTEAEQNPAL